MSEIAQNRYDQYIDYLRQALPKVNPNFVHRVLYLERKLEGESIPEPSAVLTIEYKSDSDMDGKLNELREKYFLEAERTDINNILLAVGRMKLDKIEQISADEDIVEIRGKASPVIRS